jgi:hypothetical protein
MKYEAYSKEFIFKEMSISKLSLIYETDDFFSAVTFIVEHMRGVTHSSYYEIHKSMDYGRMIIYSAYIFKENIV